MGYGSIVMGHRVWCLKSKKIIISKYVIVESVMLSLRKNSTPCETSTLKSKDMLEFEIDDISQPAKNILYHFVKGGACDDES